MAAYLRLLIQNRFASLWPEKQTGSRRAGIIAVLKSLGIGLLALVAYGSVAFLEYMLFDLLNGLGQGRAVIGLALLGCTLIPLIYGFFHVNGTLFFGRDTAFLAALPISSRAVLTGKMLMVILGEAGVALMFAAPMIVGYGIASGAGLAFYLKSIIAFSVVSLIPLTIAVLLSFVLIRISALWKRRENVTTILSLLIFAGIMLAEFKLQGMSEAEVTSWLFSLVTGQRSLTQLLMRNMPWLQWANDGILTAGAEGWLKLGEFVLVSAAVMTLAIALLGGGYMKLAVRQAEAIGQVNRSRRRMRGKDSQRSPVFALMMQEMREVLTVPVYATNCLIGIIAMPVMLLSVAFSAGEGGGLQQLLPLLDFVPRMAYVTVATGVFGFIGMMNEAPSTAISREGRCHELRKTYPVSGGLQLRAKVYMGVTFHAMAVLLVAIAVCFILPAFWLETLAAAVCSVTLAFLFSLLGVMIDVRAPKLSWKTETEAIKQNFNAVLAMLACLLAMGLIAGLAFLCLRWGTGWLISFAAAMALTLLLDIAAVLWLNRFGEKAYHAH